VFLGVPHIIGRYTAGAYGWGLLNLPFLGGQCFAKLGEELLVAVSAVVVGVTAQLDPGAVHGAAAAAVASVARR
jgi:uncharacterized membrane protein